MIASFRKTVHTLRQHPRFAIVALILIIAGIGTAAVYGWAQYHLRAAQQALDRYSFAEAQRHIDLCLKVRSGSADVHVLAAQTARRRDAYDEAEQHLLTAFQLGGMTEAIALERSLLAAQQGNLDSVERSLQQRTGTDYPEAGLVLEALGKGFVKAYRDVEAFVCLNILLKR